MTDEPERIAKRLARAGVASRRAAEAMVAEGRVAVNGKPVDSPAVKVGPLDRIAVDGRPVEAPEAPRLWRYYKPVGLVTTESDEKGRPTVFASLPADLPRVLSVGRLDLNSEGLLLLTNDGGLKRRLELPSTGWVRKYRVRARGAPQDATFDPLRRGVSVGGERFAPMSVAIDRQQGSNVWLTVGLREGRNREVRRALETVGLEVNRLIRVSYGPFQLGELQPGAVEEIRPRVLREQLGIGGEATAGRARAATQGAAKTGPAKAGPAQAGPPKPGPVEAGSAKAQASAAKASPAKAGAAKPSPAKAGPAKTRASGAPGRAPRPGARGRGEGKLKP